MEKVKISRVNQGVKNLNDYQNLLNELKSIIKKGKNKIYKIVDNNLVETRWQIGERIVREELKYQDRADYGEYLLKNLAIDLKTTRPRLSEIIRFYKCYPIVRTLCEQLSWRHYVLLITIVNQKERKFYEQKIIVNSWSVRELARQIKNRLYQKTDDKEKDEILKTKLPTIVDLQKIFKPDYENDTIGLIICKEAGREEVIYALDGLEEKIFVSLYKTKLPSEEQIKRAVRGI